MKRGHGRSTKEREDTGKVGGRKMKGGNDIILFSLKQKKHHCPTFQKEVCVFQMISCVQHSFACLCAVHTTINQTQNE